MGELKIVSHAAMLNLYDREEELADICSALADPTRRKIIKVINLRGPSTINEIAWQINVPVSTTSYHVKELIKTGLLIFTNNTKRRGNEKTVARGDCRFDIFLADTKQREPIKALSYPIPIGSYTDFVAEPTCGIILRDGSLNVVDNPAAFYSPRRAEAGLIWLHSGYLEYSVPLLDYIEKTEHEGGFNIFGSNFGDYPQDIILDITYLAYKAK